MAETNDGLTRIGQGQNGRLLANDRWRGLRRGSGQRLPQDFAGYYRGRLRQTNASSLPFLGLLLHARLIQFLAQFGPQGL